MKLGTLMNDFMGTVADRYADGPVLTSDPPKQRQLLNIKYTIPESSSALGFAAPDIAGLLSGPQDSGESKLRPIKSSQSQNDQSRDTFYDHVHDKPAPSKTDPVQDGQEESREDVADTQTDLTDTESDLRKDVPPAETLANTDVALTESRNERPANWVAGTPLFAQGGPVADVQDGQNDINAFGDTETPKNGIGEHESEQKGTVKPALSIFEMQATVATTPGRSETTGATMQTSLSRIPEQHKSMGLPPSMPGLDGNLASPSNGLVEGTRAQNTPFTAHTIRSEPASTELRVVANNDASATPTDPEKTGTGLGDRGQAERAERFFLNGQAAGQIPAVSRTNRSNSAPILDAAVGEKIAQISPHAAAKQELSLSGKATPLAMNAGGQTDAQHSPASFEVSANTKASTAPEFTDIRNAASAQRSRDSVADLAVDRTTPAPQQTQSAAPITAVNVTDQTTQTSVATAAETAGVDVFGDTTLETRGAEFDIMKPGSQQQTAFATSQHPTTHLRASPAQAATHLGQLIIQGDETLSEITMDPEELGKLRFQIVQADAGLTISITAERPETLDMMRRHIEQLQQDLSQNGFEDVNFSFSQGENGDPTQDGTDSNDGTESSVGASKSTNGDSVPAAHLPPITQSASNGIDIRL